jgi:hypothetical protein
MSNTRRAAGQVVASILHVPSSTPVVGLERSGMDLREPLSSKLSAEFRGLSARYRVLLSRSYAGYRATTSVRQELQLNSRLPRGTRRSPRPPGVKIAAGSAEMLPGRRIRGPTEYLESSERAENDIAF